MSDILVSSASLPLIICFLSTPDAAISDFFLSSLDSSAACDADYYCLIVSCWFCWFACGAVELVLLLLSI